MRSDKQLNVNCDVDSNPDANCEWVYGNEVLEGSDCNTMFELTTSNSLKCKAKNSQYASDFDERSLYVTVIDANR